MNISELLNVVNNLVPLKYAFEDDYVGITIGSEQDEVKGIVIGHELDKSLLEYCKNKYVNTVFLITLLLLRKWLKMMILKLCSQK